MRSFKSHKLEKVILCFTELFIIVSFNRRSPAVYYNYIYVSILYLCSIIISLFLIDVNSTSHFQHHLFIGCMYLCLHMSTTLLYIVPIANPY